MKKSVILFALLGAAACSKSEPPPEAQPATTGPPVVRTMNVDLLKAAPTQVLANELIRFEPIEAHHFEVKAPQACGEFEPTEKTPRRVVCQLTEPGKHEIALNICDDAKTSCKPVRYELTASAPAGFESDGSHPRVLQPPRHAHAPVSGFLINKPDEAVAQAKKDGKLLFVHFYGIWCPPCNMLEEYVYGDKAFLEATNGMVRVMLDADSDLSWDWKAKFKIGGYPTVVIATADLQEIDRMVGYRPPAKVVKWAQDAAANKDTPIAALMAKWPIDKAAEAPADVRKRIGLYHYERREFDEAAKWLAGHPDPAARMAGIQAEQEIANRNADDARALELTKQLIKEFPNDLEYSNWVQELIEKKDPLAPTLTDSAFANLAHWRTDPRLGETGYIVPDVVWMEGDLHAALKDGAAAKASYKEAADLFGEMAKRSSLEVARGANMERAYALHKAGENEAAKALYTELASTYADEFSFNYNFAHVLDDLGEREKAYGYAKKAVANSYGDNWLRARWMQAKIEDGLGKRDEAKKTIDDTLAAAVVPRSTDVRTHGYLRRLRTLRRELDKPAKAPTDPGQ